MPESVPADAKWQWDYIDHYHLDEAIIDGFLVRKWGLYKYFVKVCVGCDSHIHSKELGLLLRDCR